MRNTTSQLFALCENIPRSAPDRALALVRTLSGKYELHFWHCDYDESDLSDTEERNDEEVKTIESGVAERLLKEFRSLSLPLSDFTHRDFPGICDGGTYKLTVGDDRDGVTCFWHENPGCEFDAVARFARHVWNVWDGETEDGENEGEDWMPPRAYVVIKYVAPLHWEGYAIKEFLEHDYLGKMSYASLAGQEIATKTFGRSDMELAWLYFLLQRADRGGFSRGLNEVDKPDDSAANKPSWYHLLFWETADLSFPDCFQGRGPYWPRSRYEAFKRTDEFREILDYAARALSGRARNGKWQTRLRDRLEPKQANLVSTLHESTWIDVYRSGPAQTLALSFKAAGCLNALKASLRIEDANAFLRENFSRAAFAARLRGERTLVPDDLWEARLMLFTLSRWAFFSEDGNWQDPFEFDDNVLSRIFALLYLRLYRKGPDESHLTRSHFRKGWEAIPFAEKEAYAAKCRNHLLKTRNRMWLCAD